MNLLKKNCVILLLMQTITFPLASQVQISDEDYAWVDAMFRPAGSPALPQFSDGYGVAFRDINNDSLADLYIVRFRNLNRFFINQRPLFNFTEHTIETGLGGNFASYGEENLELGASAADYDNDGNVDVLIVGWGVTTALFQQTGHLDFNDNTLLSETQFPIDGNAGVWSDVDLDGDLDLFITDEHYPNHLLINDGKGGFTDQTEPFGLYLDEISQGASFADIDLDGDADLYLCNWYAADILYENIDGDHFEAVELPIMHLDSVINSNGVSFGDINNDGTPDLLVTDRQGSTRLYLNQTIPGSGEWHFHEATMHNGIESPYPAYGSVIADLNNDGWQDIFIANIGPNRFFLNKGGSFVLVYEEPEPPKNRTAMYSTGAAIADVDLDGDLDLFVSGKDTSSALFRNPLSSPATSIRFNLEGVNSNRDGIGAKVWLHELDSETEDVESAGYREISGGNGYLSMSEPVAHFGTNAGKRYSAIVEFPSGRQLNYTNIRPGSRIHAAETGGFQKAALRAWKHISRVIQMRQFWLNATLFALLTGLISAFLSLATRRYKWQNRQVIFFMMGAFALAYALFWLLPDSATATILLVESAGLFIVMGVLVGFLEKIHRLEAERFGYRQILEDFSQRLIFIKDNQTLYTQTVNTISGSLGVEFCALLEILPGQAENGASEPQFQAVARAVAGDWPHHQYSMMLDKLVLELLRTEVITDIGQQPDFAKHAETRESALIVSLSRQERLFALLLLGQRKTGADFASEDRALLQIVARQAAVAIENNLYIEETRELAQKLAEARVQAKYVTELEEKNHKLEQLYRELQETQGQLIQSEKMASLGQLVAGIAHELNNPISFVYANMKELQRYIHALNQLLSAIKDNPFDAASIAELRKTVESINQAHDLDFIHQDIDNLINESLHGSQRVKQVVQNLRNFSRLDEAEFKEVDLHDGIDSTLILLNNELKNRITVHKSYGTIPLVYCNPGHINQVFMNLLLNAAQAIEGNGDIRIETRTAGKVVEVSIHDNGRGIPADIRDKIFDPFYTTKPVGKGTGLGLSISYNIIQKHGGRIDATSEPGEGTTFTMTLPVHNTSNNSGTSAGQS